MGCTSHAPRRSETAVCSGVGGGGCIVREGGFGGVQWRGREGGWVGEGNNRIRMDGHLGVRVKITCKAA